MQKIIWLSSHKITVFYRLVTCFVWLFFKVCYRHRVYGAEKIPPGATLLAGNHTSYLDPPAIGISSPEEVHFLAQSGLFKNRYFSWLIRLLNAHPLQREKASPNAFKVVFSLLEEGKKVVFFPEGKRSLFVNYFI